MKVTEPIGILRISHSTCCSLLRSITEVALEHLVGLPSASSLQGWQAFATSSIQLPKESLCGLWCCCSSCNMVYKWDPLLTLGSKFILMQVVAMPSSEWSELDRLLHLINRILSRVPSVMLHTYLCFIIYMFAFEDTVSDMIVKTCFQYTENEPLSLIFYHTDSVPNGSWMSEWDLIPRMPKDMVEKIFPLLSTSKGFLNLF